MIKFDLTVPAGCFCQTTQFLRARGLQDQSLPLDWLVPVDLSMAVNYLENTFAHFFESEDLVMSGINYKNNISYLNTRSGIRFLHDFCKENDFSESYKLNKDKYERRIDRLFKKIDASNKILFFHLHCRSRFSDTCDEYMFSDCGILESFYKLSKMFPQKNIFLLYIRLCEDEKRKGFELATQKGNCSIYNCYRDRLIKENHNLVKQFETNIHSILDVFFDFNAFDKLCRLGRRSLIVPAKLLSCLIPSQVVRKKIRRWYKMY